MACQIDEFDNGALHFTLVLGRGFEQPEPEVHMAPSNGFLSSVVYCFALVTLASCAPDVTSREFAEKTTGGSAPALAPAPPDAAAVQYSRFAPENPADEIVQGLLSQTIFDSAQDKAAMAALAKAPRAGAPRYAVEVRNLVVGPGRRTASATLPGAGVFEVRTGAGSI
jgi:hypothetical protein